MKRFKVFRIIVEIIFFAVFVCVPEVGRASQDGFMPSLIDKAQTLSEKPYAPPAKLPEIFNQMTYDDWRSIRMKPGHAYWHQEQLPFEIQFFHPGFVYDRTIKINIIRQNTALPLLVSKDLFDYKDYSGSTQLPEHIGPAGFRIHTGIKQADYLDEFLVFLGGSYFRAVGRDNVYGLSARGVAIDTALPRGEEFPWFREFWIVEPQRNSQSLKIYALLDSPRLTGAFCYEVQAGKTTQVIVESHLFLRNEIEKIGIAPLTSMFFFGENNRQPGRYDFRPEVHDSDGLLIHSETGEWLWRPLKNPRSLQVNSFFGSGVKGFGLLQRDEDFRSYEDLEAHYQSRPSVWIEPLSDWGPGHIELVQIPTNDEIHDNIVAYFVPDAAYRPGQELTFNYRMTWGNSSVAVPGGARAVSSRIATDGEGESFKFVVDFKPGELNGPLFKEIPNAVVNVDSGANIVDKRVMRNTEEQTWRLVFEVELLQENPLEKILPDDGRGIEIRAFLRSGADVLSETWSYMINRREFKK